MGSKVKVFHVEDYKIMRDGLRLLLSQDHEIEVVGEARSGEEAMNRLALTEVNVIILDLYLDAMEDLTCLNGFQFCKIIRDKYPAIKIIAHSAYDHADSIAKILKAGAAGFVSKKSGFAELAHAVKVVHSGKLYICTETSKRLKNLNGFLLGIENILRSKDEVFSRREREILNLLARGKSSKEIADLLSITERTVETHRKNMIEKGGVKNTVELVAYASSLGITKH